MWDWRYPQWLAGIVPMPPATEVPELAVGTPLALGPVLAEPYLREGWSWAEKGVRWSDETVARLQFALHHGRGHSSCGPGCVPVPPGPGRAGSRSPWS